MNFPQGPDAFRRSIPAAGACALTSAAVLAAVPLLFGAPDPMVNIEWRDLADADRIALERQFALTEPSRLEEDRWAYVPSDTSPTRLRAIVRHPVVAGADGIDRRAFTISDSPPLTVRRGGLIPEPAAWMARSAKALAYLLAGVAILLLASSAPWIGSPMRAAATAWRADPVAELRALPGRASAWMQRGVPTASAEAAGLFRIIFGSAVVAFVVSDPLDPAVLQSFDAQAAQGPYGAALRWLDAHPLITRELGTWLKVSGALFIAGFCTPITFLCFVIGFLVWMSMFTVSTSTHPVAVLGITLIALVAARWGDAWSVDAWLRRAWGRNRALPRCRRYGFGIWVPRLVMGIAFVAAAWSKVGGGFDWVLNGTVKYHFITDFNQAWVSWGPALTQYHSVAVVLSAFAVLVEAVLVTAAFSRSEAYRLVVAAASLVLLAGFALFQGVLWWAWWILLMAFLPWERLADALRNAVARSHHPSVAASHHRTVAGSSFSPAQTVIVAVLMIQQLLMSLFQVEARPLFSAYDMYATTYVNAENYESSTMDLVYRVVVFEGSTSRDLPECIIDEDLAPLLPAAAKGATTERARMRSVLAECLGAAPAATAVALEGDRRVYDWQARRFGWKRAVDVIGPVSVDWLRP